MIICKMFLFWDMINIREERCFGDSGYTPYITANKEVKFLKK